LINFQKNHFKDESFFDERILTNQSENLILQFENLDSSNTFAKKIDPDNLDRNTTLIIAENQTAGHGRLNRSWFSTSKHSLTFTLIKKCQSNIQIELLPLITALALTKAIDHYVDPNMVDIKWPNDILIKNKKVAGILIENRLFSEEQILFIGIGINIKSSNFPEEIINIASSIEDHTNVSIDKDELLNVFLSEFEILFNSLCQSENNQMIDEYSKRSSYVQNKKISYIENGHKKIGTSDGLDTNGALFCVDEKGDRHRLIVSEIHSIRKGEL